jgi:hypothetical protein
MTIFGLSWPEVNPGSQEVKGNRKADSFVNWYSIPGLQRPAVYDSIAPASRHKYRRNELKTFGRSMATVAGFTIWIRRSRSGWTSH